MSRDQLAWALVGLFNLLALVVLTLGFGRLAGYTLVFSWQLIVSLAVATLVLTGVLLRLLGRR